MPLHVISDADDFLWQFDNPLRLFNNRKYGYSHTREDYYGRPFGRLWGMRDYYPRLKEFYESDDFKQLPVLDDAQPAMGRILAIAMVSLLTSRHPMTDAVTRDSFARDFGTLHDLRFSCDEQWNYSAKDWLAREMGGDVLLEDSWTHACTAAQRGMPAVLIDHPNNHTHYTQDLLYRAFCHAEVADVVEAYARTGVFPKTGDFRRATP